jgi:hypothetical protein
MRLNEIDFFREVLHADHREVNLRAQPLAEELFYALARRAKIEAPFRKLLVQLWDQSEAVPEREVAVMLGVAEAHVVVDLERVLGGNETVATLLDALERAVVLVERECSWDGAAVRDIAREMRTRDRIGWIELERLGKRDRAGRTVRVHYHVTHERSSVVVTVSEPSGAERSHEVGVSEPPRPLYLYFPVRTSQIKGSTFFLRDREGGVLAEVPLD